VATNIASVNTVATNINDVIKVADDLNEAISEVETVANDLNEATSEIEVVSNNITDVNTVGNSTNIANIGTVAGEISPTNNISTLAAISADITQAASDSADIQTVSSDSADIRTLADIEDGTVATNAVSNAGNNSTNITTVAGQISPTNNISTVATAATNVGIVASQISPTNNISTVAGANANISTIASDLSGSNTIGTVATDLSGSNTIGTVATNITDVQDVATNISGVNSFSERYRVASSDPTTSLDAGDLAFNTTGSVLKYYDGSSWQGITAGGITDVVQDSSPQLGGDLDVNGQDIVSTSNADIDIIPNGTGKTNFGGTNGIVLPSGTTGQRVNTTGVLRFNSTTGLAEYFDGASFKAIDAPPTVSSISPTSLGQSVLGSSQSIVVTGSGFSNTVTAVIIGNDETEYTPASTTRDSATQVTITTPTNLTQTNEPYDIKIINNSSLAATLADALSINDTPVFATASGSLGTLADNGRASSNLTSISFSDEESTPTLSVTSGSLPSGVTLNSNGTFSGTANPVASDTTSTFTVTATDGSETATRQYTITVNRPIITFATSAGTLGTILDDDRASYSLSAVTATVTTGTLSYAVQSGSLPSGLSLNTSTGAITGTATQVGSNTTSTFTIRATTTSASAFTDRQFTITVNAPIPATISVSGVIYSGAASNLVITASPTDGTVDVVFKEGATTLATLSNQTVSSNSLTVAVPSAVYNQSAGDTISITVVDRGTTSNAINITVTALPSGGTITNSGGYRIHTFNSSGTFTNTIANLSVEYLVIAGGGGGGYDYGGGGGAGGYRTSVSGATSGRNSSAESALTLSTGNKTVTVGGGGGQGANGSNSVFDSITSTGGGKGTGETNTGTGGNGGSGGGAWYSGSGGSGTSGQGFDGGDGVGGSPYTSGGGGGAGSAGTNGTGSANGNAGNGLSNSITGSAVTRGGGGGVGYSSDYNIAGTSGGSGGGGNGSFTTGNGSSGSANTGGGGGGAGGSNDSATAGSGGSGVVIVRYQV
jgi:hypothetical protein